MPIAMVHEHVGRDEHDLNHPVGMNVNDTTACLPELPDKFDTQRESMVERVVS